MFQKILQWIKGVLSKMIGKTDIKKAIGADIAVSERMATALTLWTAMYEDNSPWLTEGARSTNLPAAIAGEISRSVTLEMSVVISGSARAKYLQEQIETFLPYLRDKVEVGVAKGGLMLKPYVDGKAISVDFVQADCFYPIKFDANGNITACVFSDQKTIGDYFYTRLEFHSMTDAGYEIRNLAYRSSSRDMLGNKIPLNTVEEWASLEEEATISNIEKPLFAYFRNPGANVIDKDSPLGVSCFARAVGLIEDIDKQWDNFLWEMESSRRALYVDTLAFGKDDAGLPKLPDKRLYRTLDGGGQDDSMFNEWSPDIREQNFLNANDAVLKKIEFNCGLAYGTLSNPQTTDKTATEIKISRQRSYATITDTQKALRSALEGLVWAMDVWATLYNLSQRGTYSITCDFDDSVIVDKDLQFQQDLRLVSASVMSKLEFRMRNFGEDEAAARKALSEVDSEQPDDMFSETKVE